MKKEKERKIKQIIHHPSQKYSRREGRVGRVVVRGWEDAVVGENQETEQRELTGGSLSSMVSWGEFENLKHRMPSCSHCLAWVTVSMVSQVVLVEGVPPGVLCMAGKM